ncbi:MAG: hypothetical protein VB071_05775 [Lawsonibacter sp.]|nr:hypothetical protein [Lawsonibacter sp.]
MKEIYKIETKCNLDGGLFDMKTYEKPPLGVAPHWFLYRVRMRDLTEAISRSGPYYEAIEKWSEELKTLAELESILQRGNP